MSDRPFIKRGDPPGVECCRFFPQQSILVDSRRIAVDVRPDLQSKTKKSEAIEVEVVEVDGITVPERPTPAGESPPPRTGASWQEWQGKVMQLDARWWPVWVFLGIIGVALLMTFGVIIGVIFVIFRIIKAILNAIFG